MKRKKLFFVGAGSMIAGIIFSLQPYNPGRFQTVHEFAIQCHLRSDHFLEVFGGSLAELDWCLHNTGLSLALYTIIGIGAFLIYKSGIRQ